MSIGSGSLFFYFPLCRIMYIVYYVAMVFLLLKVCLMTY